MLRRPGALFNRRRHFRGSIGQVIAPGVSPLLLFSDGTFTRSTEASLPLIYQPGDTVTWHGVNVLRESSILTPDGLPYFAFEGSRTNQILQSRQPGGTSWSTIAPITRGADATTGPDGATTADRLQTGPTTGAAYQATGVHGAGSKVAATIFARMSDTETVHHWRYGTGLSDAGTTHASDTITAQWQRFAIIHTANAAAEDYIVVSEAADQSGLGGYTALDQDLYLDLCQAEPGAAFPSSAIRTTTAQVTRAADDLSYAAGTWPEEINSGAWRVHVRPSWASTEPANSSFHYLMQAGTNSPLFLFQNAGTMQLWLDRAGSTVLTRALTFAAGQELTITVDWPSSQVTIAGASTGNGTFGLTGSPVNWGKNPAADTLYIARSSTPLRELYGLISEPVAA